ncbi:hypothetical protein [Flavobacterium sp.]|uniref:hypothetical protein n=1 Tax=Flavobacterium sp. TaxID=239 RepID=UPI002FDB611D
MKKVILVFSFLIATISNGQELDITPQNSWFKAGINAGIPIGDAADFSSFTIGLDLRGQYLVNPHFGIGIASGYTHFLGKDGADDFGIIPVGGFARYYFKQEGLFIGSDLGYAFLTNVDQNSGGFYVNPQIGYHNKKWNIYGYYQHTFAENSTDIQTIGIGATYNIMF